MKKLIATMTISNWGTYKANWFCKTCLSVHVISSCPPNGIMYKDDGAQRNNDNLLGHVVEFEINKEHKAKFKTCVIKGQTVGIDHFAAYDRNENVSRLVFSYNQSVGKTADSLRACTEESFDDFNDFIKLWQQEDNKQILVKSFDEEQINFSPLNLRVNAYGAVLHIVKYNIIFVIFISIYKFVQLHINTK